MSEFRYSPEPTNFYTFYSDAEVIGSGTGYSALHLGFWNLVWLTCSNCDEYEKPENEQGGLPIWTEDYLQPFLQTAKTEFAGTRVEDLAAALRAETFVDYLVNHQGFKDLPLYKAMGHSWLIALLDRSKKSADIRISDHTLRQRLLSPNKSGPDLTPQTLTRGKIVHMKDWLARFPGA